MRRAVVLEPQAFDTRDPSADEAAGLAGGELNKLAQELPRMMKRRTELEMTDIDALVKTLMES